MFRPPFKLHNIFKQMEFVGVKSIFVVVLTGTFTGMVMALQGYHGFRMFSAESLVGGTDITKLNDRALNEIRKKFGMLFQEAALFDSMTVGENVAFPLREHTPRKMQSPPSRPTASLFRL
jgi:ABC-type transporter Mla maintaining outer membrane lipid asymmetry ATPase subunit MlaF